MRKLSPDEGTYTRDSQKELELRSSSWWSTTLNVHWRYLPLFLVPCIATGKESTCNVGDLGSIPGLGRYPGEENGYPLQYSGLKFHGLYSPWGRKELDTTEQLSLSLSL